MGKLVGKVGKWAAAGIASLAGWEAGERLFK